MAKTWFRTPLGYIGAVAGRDGIVRITLPRKKEQVEEVLENFPDLGEGDEYLEILLTEITDYFRGEAVKFTVPVDLSAVTRFEQAVLSACREIPYGRTSTYSDLAATIGRPRCARAVGNALRKNPAPIVIPCHRVLRKGGQLGGFAWGLDMKRKLLELEGIRQ